MNSFHCLGDVHYVRAGRFADLAIALMNEILVARNAFEAYLIISAGRHDKNGGT